MVNTPSPAADRAKAEREVIAEAVDKRYGRLEHTRYEIADMVLSALLAASLRAVSAEAERSEGGSEEAPKRTKPDAIPAGAVVAARSGVTAGETATPVSAEAGVEVAESISDIRRVAREQSAKLTELVTEIVALRGRLQAAERERDEALDQAGRQQMMMNEEAGLRQAADARAKGLEAALRTIEAWKDFPATGQFYEGGNPVPYGCWLGSNGERDYMRAIARAALAPTVAKQETDNG